MRWIIRAFMLVLVVVAVAVVSLLMLPGERIANIAADQISSLTGRQVTMQGETTVSFYPILGISTGAVTVANADWGQGGPMFQAQSLKIGVEPQALWGGDVRITGLEAVGPIVNLERAADGRVNWELGVENVAPSGQSEPGAPPARSDRLALTLDRALVENATFIYTDHGAGARTEMRGMAFELRWPEYEGRATFDATLRPAGQAVQVTGHLGRVGDFIDGAVGDLKATVRAPGGEATFTGRASAAPEAQGRLTAKIGDTARFLAALGLPAADIPSGLGRSITGETLVTFGADRRLALRDLAAQLDGNRVTGEADVDLSAAKPVVTARIDAGALDLSGLGGGESGAAAGSGGTGATEDGWSKDPIDASALALADGRIALTADSIDLGDLKTAKIRSMISLDRSRLVLDLGEVRAYDGLITGEFVINNRSGLSVGGDLTAAGLDMEGFLTDAAGITRFSGTADASISFLGVGRSEHAIMNSLSGKGAVRTGRGVISGIDLDRLMRSGEVTGGTTIFDEMGMTFTISDGLMTSDDLVMEMPFARATGKGGIGLGARNINYLFTPVLLQGETSRGLAIPVRIKGPWADPKITPDLGKAIDLNLSEERKELKEDVKQEVRRAVEKELGVEVQEGQSLEDALEDRLKEEVGKELLKLFD